MLFNSSKIDYNSVVLFVHIPKSGGSSVENNLLKYFKINQVIRIYQPSISYYYGKEINSQLKSNNNSLIKNSIKRFKFVKKILKYSNSLYLRNIYKQRNKFYKDFNQLNNEELQNLRFISSTLERNVVPPILGKHYLQITTIRDPVSRIQSYYFQAKKQLKSRKPYIAAAKKYNVNDFIKYLYDYNPHMLSNPYSVCLTGTENYLLAKKKIDTEFFLAAPIEKMDEFLYLLTLKLFNDPNKNFLKFNIGYNNSKNILINDNLISKIISTNKSDIELKKYIELEFDSIYKSIIT